MYFFAGDHGALKAGQVDEKIQDDQDEVEECRGDIDKKKLLLDLGKVQVSSNITWILIPLEEIGRRSGMAYFAGQCNIRSLHAIFLLQSLRYNKIRKVDVWAIVQVTCLLATASLLVL